MLARERRRPSIRLAWLRASLATGLGGADQRAEDADIELKAARKQDGVLSASKVGEPGLKGTVFWKIAADEARCRGSARS
jgi:hypothetical protein